MAIKKGRELVFTWDSTAIGNVTSFSLNVDGNIIDISDWDSGDWNEKLAGRKDWTMDISLNHNGEGDTGQGEAEVDMISGTRSATASFGPASPSTGDVTFSGTAILSNFALDASDSDGVITSSFSLSGNGTLTRTVAA